MLKIIVIGFFLFICSISFGQLFDPIRKSLKEKPTYDIRLSTHNAFVANQFAKIKGVKLGLSYNKIFKFGIGYSWMKSKITSIYDNDSVNLRLNYILAYVDYTFYQTKYWDFSLPIQMGIGLLDYKTNDKIRKARSGVAFYEPSMAFDYKFLKYFSAGVGFGYRLAIKNREPITERFTSPIYTIRFKIEFGKMYKDVME
jgi:hypothetical protein